MSSAPGSWEACPQADAGLIPAWGAEVKVRSRRRRSSHGRGHKYVQLSASLALGQGLRQPIAEFSPAIRAHPTTSLEQHRQTLLAIRARHRVIAGLIVCPGQRPHCRTWVSGRSGRPPHLGSSHSPSFSALGRHSGSGLPAVSLLAETTPGSRRTDSHRFAGPPYPPQLSRRGETLRSRSGPPG